MAQISACPALPAPSSPQAVARNLGGPDDLAFDAQGRLLFSDVNSGSVSAVHADGSIEKLVANLSEPEGILPLPDGRLLVAEQGKNRIVAIDATTHAPILWRAFPNRTANAGIDGIGPLIAPNSSSALLHAGEVIVPDSPNGVIYSVTQDGSKATRIASGLSRPVGAASDQGGRLLVADEGGWLWASDPGLHRLASLATPDDVLVASDGNIFVNTLGDNAIHELDRQGHKLTTYTGIGQPQGIAFDAAENLYYTRFDAGVIDRLVRTFTLDPPTVTRLGANRFLVCPAVRRAAAFTAPLSLGVADDPRLAILQLLQPGASSSGAIELQTTQPAVELTIGDGTHQLSQAVVIR